MLAALCDMRIPLSLSVADCHDIADTIGTAVARAAKEKQELS